MNNDLVGDPISRFSESFQRAAENPPFDHTAMTLVTASQDVKPTGRVVLLKEFDTQGFVFFGNYESQKGEHLDANPHAALCFFWPWIGEQIRVEGTVSRISGEESDAYFASRPRGSQVGAWGSAQSRPLESREALIQRCAEIEEKYNDGPIPRPEHWGGWRLVPTRIEFWINGEFRLHDRFLYTRPSPSVAWKMVRLNP